MFKVSSVLGQKRYSGREKALVIDTRDPAESGRIRVNSRTLGDSNWIPYVMSPGFFTPPKIGDWVYIECEDGLEWAPVAHGKVVNLAVDLNGDPDSVYREVPTVSAWTSNGALGSNGQVSTAFGPTGFIGHAILLDDGQQVYGQAPNGNTNAGIKVFSYGGSKLIFSDDTSNKKILLADFNNTSTPLSFNTSTGNRIVIDPVAGLITIENNSNTTYITIGATDINIVASGNCNITTTGKTVVSASEVDVTAPIVDVTSTSMVTMTTPLLDVSGFITCSGIATGNLTPTAGNAVISGSLTANGNVSDSVGSMATIRSTYDVHTHGVTTAPGTTTTPTPTM
jgi:hypothetical protein